MEPCHLIAEEWGSLSGQFTAEETDFMSQLLGHGGNYSSMPIVTMKGTNSNSNSYFASNVTNNNTNFLCFSSQENNSSSTDSGNTFSTTTSSDHYMTPKNDSLSMVFSLEDAKLFSHSFPWDDDNLSQQINESNLEPVKLVLADNNLHAKEEHEMMVCEPYDQHRSKKLENPAKRLRSSIEVSKNTRNVRKNSRATISHAATDAQSIYARRRRERINERLKILQNLVPNGTKVDISTMLEEAVQYVKFLQHQIKLLSSDDLWMYAPLAFNGINIGLDHIM